MTFGLFWPKDQTKFIRICPPIGYCSPNSVREIVEPSLVVWRHFSGLYILKIWLKKQLGIFPDGKSHNAYILNVLSSPLSLSLCISFLLHVILSYHEREIVRVFGESLISLMFSEFASTESLVGEKRRISARKRRKKITWRWRRQRRRWFPTGFDMAARLRLCRLFIYYFCIRACGEHSLRRFQAFIFAMWIIASAFCYLKFSHLRFVRSFVFFVSFLSFFFFSKSKLLPIFFFSSQIVDFGREKTQKR